jgi:serine/threonine protein kinase, bacterial
MKMKRISALAVCAAALAIAGCGGGGGGGASSSPTPVPSGTVSGVAAKGLLLNAIVSFYSVTNGVASTSAITSVRTDAKTGAFSTSVASSGPVVVTVTTDSTTRMLDEISGTAITAPTGLILHTVFDSVTNLQPISVTPLTEMAYDIAKSSTGALTTTNIDAANNAVSTAFLAGAPALYTQPIDTKTYASATAAEQEQAKFLVALAVAANEGIATGASGSPCATTYSANIVCLIGGLGNLLSVNSSGAITLASAGTYISAAYASIDSGAVTINGGQTPSALGLNVATAAETSFLAAIAKQAPLAGYNAGADPLSNTKALFANVRMNILDQATTQTFGYAPTLTALESDYRINVHPVLANTSALVTSAYKAAQLIQYSTTTAAGAGAPSQYISNPYALAADATGNLFVVNGANSGSSSISKVVAANATSFAGQAVFTYISAIAVDSGGNVYVADNNMIREISPSGTVTSLAGQAGVFGNSDGTGSAASFSSPTGLTVDASGNVWVADAGNQAIRRITQAGVVTTLTIQPGSNCGGQSICLPYMAGIALDSSGNLYVTDPGFNVVQKITPSGVVSTIAGQMNVYGDVDGVGSAAIFSYPTAITIDATGNLYVIDSNNAAVRKITPAGLVSTVAQTHAHKGLLNTNELGNPTGLALDPAGNIYVADEGHSSIQEIDTTGAITTFIHGLVNYSGACGYDPVGLATATNVALCRYGLSNNQILLTVTQTGVGTYSTQTQALATSSVPFMGTSYFSPLNGYAVVPSIPALQSSFTWTTNATGAQSATFSGPYYVNASGGEVQGSLSAAESSDWNAATDTGTLTLGGALSGGTGGVSLVNATIGSDSVISIQNGARLLNSKLTPIVSAGSPAVIVTGAIDLAEFTTNAFSYAVKATLGAPIYDKSKALALPGTVSVTGSIDQIGANGRTALFNGMIGASFQGLPSFDATQAISATNYFTVQAQVAGTLSFTAGRVLTVTATANASQLVATPAQPDSISATYSYTTPTGTATLNASGQYDTTNGFKGMITNNAGVVVTVTDPIGGTLAATVTANGTNTATINGAFVYYSDGTSESLF